MATKYVVSNLDATACELRWPALEAAAVDAFRDARFMPGFDVDSPLRHTREAFAEPLRAAYRHVVVETDEKILGAAFRVPVTTVGGATEADPGWFFLARDISRTERVQIADEIVGQSHRLMRDAGFRRIATNMGTRDGAAYLRRRHGYQPVPGEENRWTCDL